MGDDEGWTLRKVCIEHKLLESAKHFDIASISYAMFLLYRTRIHMWYIVSYTHIPREG